MSSYGEGLPYEDNGIDIDRNAKSAINVILLIFLYGFLIISHLQ